MVVGDQIEGLLADLSAITDVARAGVISRREEKLEPGETRPAAVLYLDVVGFSALSRVLTSEQLTTLIDRTFRIFELTVKGHGGYLDKVIGDAALYVFAGHPNYPPVCEAALRAALKLKERTRQVNESLQDAELPISIRMGVAFGDVTRRQVGGEDVQVTVMGETANVAQRLEASAKPDAVQTTIRVLEKAGDVFLCQALGRQQLKGFGPVTVYEVTGIAQQEVELRGAFRRLTPLVGRDSLLDEAAKQIELWLQITHDPETLDIAAARTPLRGHNRLLILRGVTAVGKSRLAYELLDRLEKTHGAVTATAHCAKGASVGGLTAELATVARIDEENLPTRWQELCAHGAAAVSPSYAQRQQQQLPLLAYVLDCHEVDTHGIAKTDAESFETNCKLALRACCELAAHQSGKPVVLVVEDLQWLGALRDVVIDLLASVCLPKPLIVVATARPEYVHEECSLGEGEARTLKLEPLAMADGDAMLQALLPGLVLPPQLSEELHTKAAGIPYYYEEFARMLVRRGLVVERDDGFALAQEVGELDVPEDIRALILGRLDQLEPELKALAMRASVLGRSFQYKLLAAIEAQLGFVAENHPDHALAILTAQRVLAHESGDRYFFEHLLVRDTAYRALLKHNRGVLHRAAANILQQMLVPGGADEMQLLSDRCYHLHRAQLYHEAHVSLAQLLLLMASSGHFEEWDHWERMAEECLARDEVAPGEGQAASPTLTRARGVKLLRQGDHEAAREHFEESLVLSQAAKDELGEAGALCDLAILCRQAGMVDTAMQHYRQSLAIARRLKDHHMEAIVLGNIGQAHYQQGRADLAVQHYEQALEISRRHGNKRSETMSLRYLGIMHLDSDNNEAAYDLFSQVLELAQETGNRISESIALGNMGIAAHALGRSEEALQLWQQAAVIDRVTGQRESEAIRMFNLAELALENQELQAALEYYQAALALFRELHNIPNTMLAFAAIGKVLSLLDRLEDAVQALTEAVALCDSSQNMTERGVADCCWVYYCAAAGDVKLAQAHLNSARQIAHEVSASTQSRLGSEIALAEERIAEALTED